VSRTAHERSFGPGHLRGPDAAQVTSETETDVRAVAYSGLLRETSARVLRIRS
jgi:hypothetical protein